MHYIRPMINKDIPNVLSIENAVHFSPWTKGIFEDCLLVNYDCLVLECDDEIVGYAMGTLSYDEYHILNLGVAKEKQRQGFASALLDKLIFSAKQQKAKCLFLEVRQSNEAAKKLYYKYGFQAVGIRKNYYPATNGYEDAIMLRLDL